MRRLLVALVVLAVAVPAAGSHAQQGGRGGRKDRPPTRVRLTAAPGQSLLVHGEYPAVQSSCVDPTQPLLHARYRGTVEIVRAADGSLSLIGELTFEDYLKGIAEVPRDWPMEALKAQVVAARTYALSRMLGGPASAEYDLCATTECQVYVGMKVEAGPYGRRWVRAVEETAGEALLYRGRPASTFYSSTSPGRTFDVEDVFGGEPLPYLRGGPERDDGASPLARWRVEIPFDDLARFLAEEGLWPGGAIRTVRAAGGTIEIEGRDRASMSKEALRDALNDVASCRAPGRYPTYERDGYRLPQTVPSRWYRAGQQGRTLVLRGRGWGHGVGMVQWGAFGKAERGLTYDEILASYYRGLRPQPAEIPGTIRILIAEGLTRLSIAPSGSAEIDPGPAPEGPWLIAPVRRGLRVLAGERPPSALQATGFSAAPRARAGQPVPVSLSVSDDAAVALDFTRGGEVAGSSAPVVLEEDETRLDVVAPAVPPGRYDVRAVVSDGVDVVTTPAVTVRVRPAATTQRLAPSVSPGSPDQPGPDVAAGRGPPPGGTGVWPAWAIGAAVVVAVAALLLLTGRRRRGLHRP